MPIRLQRFIVRGSGPFPVDMLRYDCCYPADTESAINMTDHEPREITLHRVMRNATDTPTIDRWRSFGWRVIAYRKL